MPKKKKTHYVEIKALLPKDLVEWVKKAAARQGLRRDKVVESALREFSSDNGVGEDLEELLRRSAQIDARC